MTIFAAGATFAAQVADYIVGSRASRPVGITDADRFFHTYVVGRTGSGKSTLLATFLEQDLRRGHGAALLDPHGDLAETVLRLVPPHRLGDVIYLNAADFAFPTPFNVLDGVAGTQSELLASALVSTFKRFWGKEFWGPRSEYIVKSAALALLERPNSTLLHMRRFLVDEGFRRSIVTRLRDASVAEYWLREYASYTPSFREEVIAPIQNKLGALALPPLLRHIVGQPRNLFDLRDVMDEGKVLVVNLAKGQIGEENAALLGSMILTRLYLAALSRADIPESERRPFFLYVDEFSSFGTEATLSGLLSEARKMKVGVTLAHQHLAQMSDELRGAVFGNVGTKITFGVSAEDAEYLANELHPLLPAQLTDLGDHTVYVKGRVIGAQPEPLQAMTLSPSSPANSYRDHIVATSRERYARPRAEIENVVTRTLSPARTSPPIATPMVTMRKRIGAPGHTVRRSSAFQKPAAASRGS